MPANPGDEFEQMFASMRTHVGVPPLNGKPLHSEPPPVTGPDDYGDDATLLDNPPIGTRPSNKASRFALEALDDIAVGDDPVDLVRGILPMGPALAVVHGPPKSLKSFLLTHIGIHIAANLTFCGRDVQAGAVVYVTSEGVRGVRRRLIVARRALGLEGKATPFFLVSVMPNLGAGPDDRALLQGMIEEKIGSLGLPARLIVIDTMRRAMPGKSENDQKDVSVVVDNCEALGRAFNCLVALVHHSPRSDDDRGSGSNALDAAADAIIGVKRDPGTKVATATVLRIKDGEEGDAWSFELRPMEIRVDCAGHPIVSCYVEVTAEPERKVHSTGGYAKPLSSEQQRVFDILVSAVAEAGAAGLAGASAPVSTRAITRDTLRQYLKTAGWWNSENDKSSGARMSARLNELAGKHAIGLTQTHVWLARAGK